MPTILGNSITEAADWLRKNETVGIPTETVYGLAANALNEIAVARIFEVKNRPFFDPLIVHLKSQQEIDRYAINIPYLARKLAAQFWPGPLTLVLEKQPIIPDLVTSGGNTVALRMPNNALTLDLLHQLDFPLAAPSANPFTYVSPTTAKHVLDQLGGKIPYVLDGGNCNIGIESTIIRVYENTVEILRHGGISMEVIRDFVPQSLIIDVKNEFANLPLAPGQMDHHYSPYCKLHPINQLSNLEISTVDAVVLWSKSSYFSSENKAEIFYLTESGDFTEGSRNLFALLRKMDEQKFQQVLFEWAPEENLGIAINDRLRRASFKRNQ